MATIKLFIADTDAEHIRRVGDCLARRQDIKIVGQCDNGSDALRAVLETPVDLLLTDVQLPGLDGIMLLRDLQRMNRIPAAIVCTRFYSGLCVDFARRYGASYVLYKPLDYNFLPELIESCCRMRRRAQLRRPEQAAAPEAPGEDRAAVVRKLLSRMGLPPRMTGSHYLTDALVRFGDDRAMMKNLSKGLYASIAERMQTTPACVERSLRTAIGAGFERGAMARYFSARPSNRQFIEYLLERIENGECGEA